MTDSIHPGKQVIGVHLDMKGMVFKPDYIPQLMRDLASQKVNAVLVEYEDIFPFEGIDIAYDPKVVWSRDTLETFRREAADNGIEIIPLQQTLGHLEYVFRWDKYANLTQDKQYPATLRMDSKKARELVLNMLGQVIDGHPDSRYIHLGMDEARQLYQSPLCEEKGGVLAVFMDWLNELVEFCEARGKTPVIWTDMLEDHFEQAHIFEALRDRVIFMPWDYVSRGETMPVSRIGGWRVSKRWLDRPDDPEAPAITPGTRFVEDMPKDVQAKVKPYERGDKYVSVHQMDVWTKLGYTAIGASLIRASSHLTVLPRFNMIHDNIRSWARAIERNNQAGLVVTSWARGNTFCPPNFVIDLTWPSISVFARAMGEQPEPFFKGVPQEKVDHLIKTLGRCREDWSIEEQVIAEMEELAPKVKTHQYEWQGLILLARLWNLRRRAEAVQNEVDYFHANARPPAREWKRRLNDQKGILREIKQMRKDLAKHFGQRYHGDAFEEWLRDVLDLHERRLRESQQISQEKLEISKERYAKK